MYSIELSIFIFDILFLDRGDLDIHCTVLEFVEYCVDGQLFLLGIHYLLIFYGDDQTGRVVVVIREWY